MNGEKKRDDERIEWNRKHQLGVFVTTFLFPLFYPILYRPFLGHALLERNLSSFFHTYIIYCRSVIFFPFFRQKINIESSFFFSFASSVCVISHPNGGPTVYVNLVIIHRSIGALYMQQKPYGLEALDPTLHICRCFYNVALLDWRENDKVMAQLGLVIIIAAAFAGRPLRPVRAPLPSNCRVCIYM